MEIGFKKSPKPIRFPANKKTDRLRLVPAFKINLSSGHRMPRPLNRIHERPKLKSVLRYESDRLGRRVVVFEVSIFERIGCQKFAKGRGEIEEKQKNHRRSGDFLTEKHLNDLRQKSSRNQIVFCPDRSFGKPQFVFLSFHRFECADRATSKANQISTFQRS